MAFKEVLKRRGKKQVSVSALKSMAPYDVLLSPLMTEKTYKQQENQNKYSFKVHKLANKNDVKQAVNYIYKVLPLSINIVSVPYKGRNQRKLVRHAYKKAVITLDKKDKIDLGI